MPERIAKRIARSGLCSRREAERWIEAGRVRVDGQIIDSPALNIDDSNQIEVDDAPLPDIEPPRLFLYHKPAGLLTSHGDPQGRPTVFENLPLGLPRVISVGRLDLNTEGLLLLTNDGKLAQKLMSPRTGLRRTYRVRVYGHVVISALDSLKHGLRLKDEDDKWIEYGSIEAKLESTKSSKEHKNKWLEMTISEGKNREIRNICNHLGLQVNRLIRTEYGKFSLGKLPTNDVTELAPDQFDLYL